MAKKTTLLENDILSFYMNYVLEHNEKPTSVYSFAKANKFEESKFYEFYGSFEAIESHIFKAFFDNSMIALNKNDEFHSFDARNKLLSFYFTFFENLTANRSYVVYAMNQHKNNLQNLALLTNLKKSFIQFIRDLDIETLDTKQDQLEKIQNKALQESAWIQLVLTIKFWLYDTSASFEKTDIFIEKSVNTSFDVLNIVPLKSVIDFGKFIFKEKMHMN